MKLNANVEGGFGPSWLEQTRATSSAIKAAVLALGLAQRTQLARHLSLHDGVPVNRGSRAWFRTRVFRFSMTELPEVSSPRVGRI